MKNHMKKILMPFLALTLTLGLSACGNSPAAPLPPADAPEVTDTLEPPNHVHAPSNGNNIANHEPAGYCGNTVTTISRETGEPQEISFDGSDSVALTDLLLYLDYSGDICRCLPEYTINTEFGGEYGVNLTEGYARHDGGQTDLTEEQITLIQEILDRQIK